MNINDYLNEAFAKYPETDEFTELHETLTDDLNDFINQKVSEGMTNEQATKLAIKSIADLNQLLDSMQQATPDISKTYVFYNTLLNKVNDLKLTNQLDLTVASVDEIHINYHHGTIMMVPSLDDQVHVKEFMSRKIEKIYATGTKVGNVLNIQQGPRKLVGIFREKIEISIPDNFPGFITMTTNSGNINLINFQANCMFDLNSKSGNVNLVNVKNGRLQVDLISGSFRAKELNSNDLHLNTKSGNITLDNVTVKESGTQLAITTKSGSVKLETVKTPTFVTNSKSGNLKADRLETKFFDINVGSGTTKLTNLIGSGHLVSKSGSITAEFINLLSNTTLKSGSGSIKTSILPGNAFKFEIKSTTGSLKVPVNAKITNYKANKINGQVGSLPNSELKIATTTGAIRLN